MSSSSPKLFLILGPSGSGKGTIIHLLKERYEDLFFFPVSATTRSPRPHEKEGDTYYFLSQEDFEKKIEQGEFLEWALVHKKYYYGTLKTPIFEALEKGQHVIRELDIQGFESVRHILPRETYASIFLMPPSLEVLKKRILSRAPITPEELEKRMASAKKEISKSILCDYIVASNDGGIQEAYEEVLTAIRSEVPNLRI
jgi:guanylate kinase